MNQDTMHIGMIMDKFPSLSETFILNHIVGLIDAGHEVTIFARPPPVKFPTVHPHVAQFRLMDRVRYLPHQELSIRNVLHIPYTVVRSIGRRGSGRCLNFARYGWGALRFRALHSLEYFRDVPFDLLHCHYASIGWAFAAYRDVFNVPFVTSFHGDHYGSFGKDGRWLLSGLFRHGDAFVANSEFTRSELLRLGCAAEKIRVIPAMVTDAGTHFTEPDLTRRPIRLLTVARLHRSKGIEVAIRAMRILADRGIQATYRIVGDGPDRDRLAALVKELKLTDVVSFLGWMNQTQVYGQYRESDLFILPSIVGPNGANEAQGLVIQEAQLHGVVAVGSHIGGVPESLDFGAAGRTFAAGNPQALADCIGDLLARPDTVRALAVRAEQYVREKYTRGPVMKRTLDLYAELLDRRKAITRQPSAA